MDRMMLVSFSALALLSCGDDGTGPPEANVTGTYVLESVNGAPLPWRLINPSPTRIEVTAGSLTLSDGTSCTVSLTVRTTEDGEVTTDINSQDCQYTHSHGAITVSYANGSVDTGLISSSEISLRSDDAIFVFRR